MAEHDALVLSYRHLTQFPRANDALHTLRKVASLVKPIMRVRGWKVNELTEFYPTQSNLLGLNVNRGQQICLRLRYPGDQNQFLLIEEVVDTMLHELCHIVHGPHNAQFHALWDQLRDEHQGLLMKGYTGEGFLSEGRRLGGARLPPHEARRLAREAAMKRQSRPSGTQGGRRLGGTAPRPGADIRRVITSAIEQRNQTLQGCGSDRLTDRQIQDISDNVTRNGFRTQAAEDEANEAAIAQAMWELVQEDEKAKYGTSYIPPSAANPTGNGGGSLLSRAKPVVSPGRDASQLASGSQGWTCQTCTLQNPDNFLCCEACGAERTFNAQKTPVTRKSQQLAQEGEATIIDLTSSSPPPPNTRVPSRAQRRDPVDKSSSKETPPSSSAPLFWQCSFCGMAMERLWWTCASCGRMKNSSK